MKLQRNEAQTMDFIKVHGSENDFFMLDTSQFETPLSEEQIKQLAIKVCDRKNGLLEGADGVLLVDQPTHEGPLGKMRVINADGSEASMCGNGLRSVARYLGEQNNQQSFKVETTAADLPVSKMPQLAEGVSTYQVRISPISFKAQDLKMHVNGEAETLVDQQIAELDSDLKFTAVAVPNPHLIAFVDDETLKSDQLGALGRYLNNGTNPIFPDGVNVSFVNIIDQNKIFVRTFERGVGYTNACGTAMSASSLVSVLLHSNQVANNTIISVLNPGGMVKTKVHHQVSGESWVDLIGNATFVKHVSVSLNDALAGNFDEVTVNQTGEQVAYQDFVAQLQGA